MDHADLNTLSAAELTELAQRAARIAARKQATQADEVRRKLVEIAKADGFNAYELFGKGEPRKIGTKLTPKFANPADPSQTWVGRGKPPQWYRTAIASGVMSAEMLIPVGAP